MIEFVIGMVVGVGFFIGVGLLDRMAFKYYLDNGVPSKFASPKVQSPADH